MTTIKESATTTTGKLSLAEVLAIVAGGAKRSLRFTAYDGSSAGPETAVLGMDLLTPRGTTYLATAPGALGLARAYVSGDIEARGVPPGDPYELLKLLADKVEFGRPSARLLASIIRSVGIEHLVPAPPPPQEALPRWRRIAEGMRHSKTRDAEAIHHHYDVSNTFYEWVLGPSMTYTCAVYPYPEATLEEAQDNKYRLIFEKLRLQPGDRLLDVGCGWGGVGRSAARRRVRGSAASRSAAVWSIGLTEHIGVKNYPSYLAFLESKLRTGGLLLNPCITRNNNKSNYRASSFTDRYVFPDGELTGSGRITSEIQDAGFEVLHAENFQIGRASGRE